MCVSFNYIYGWIVWPLNMIVTFSVAFSLSSTIWGTWCSMPPICRNHVLPLFYETDESCRFCCRCWYFSRAVVFVSFFKVWGVGVYIYDQHGQRQFPFKTTRYIWSNVLTIPTHCFYMLSKRRIYIIILFNLEGYPFYHILSVPKPNQLPYWCALTTCTFW